MTNQLVPSTIASYPCTLPIVSRSRPELRVLNNRLRHTAERPCILLRASSTAEINTSEQPQAAPLSDEATLPVERLSSQEVVDRLFGITHQHAEQHYHAFFSSEIGGVTTEPALMMVHLDDHLIHRGHGVFDTAILVEGNLYMLERHLQRFMKSAEKASLPLPCSLPQIRRIILETVAASMKMDGFVRFWLGGGRGGFGISPKECLQTSFYCIVTSLPEGSPLHNPGSDYLLGRRVKTSPIAIKDPYFATLKSTNYLPNVLTVMDAEKDGLDYGIFVDSESYIAEGANMNVAILTKGGELLIPPFTHTLEGISVQRLLELIPQHIETIEKDTGGRMKSVVQRKFNKWDVYACKEAMLIGSTTYVTPIIQWDGQDLGDGASGEEPGIVALVLRRLIKKDMDPLIAPRENFSEVPYGVLTNME